MAGEPHPLVVFLRTLRRRRGLSQRTIGLLGGPRQAALSQMEHGYWVPTLATTARYAGALDLRLALVDNEGRVVAVVNEFGDVDAAEDGAAGDDAGC